MNEQARNRIIAAGAAAVITLATLGVLLDSPANKVCARAQAVGPCSVARALAVDPADVDCVDGDVTVDVEVTYDPAVGADASASLPEGITGIPGSEEAIDCAAARRPSKALTTVARRAQDTCIAGLVSKNIAESGAPRWRTWTEPHICCGDCRCDDPPCANVNSIQLAGRGVWRQRVCEKHPEYCGVSP